MTQITANKSNLPTSGSYVAAVDVGTTKVVAMIGQRLENGKIEIVDFCKAASKGIRRGEVLNLEDASRVIREVVHTLEERTQLTIQHVFVGVAGQHIQMLSGRSYINRSEQEAIISAEEIEKLKQDAYNYGLSNGQEIIHVIPQNYIVDTEMDIANPIGMIGKRLEGNFSIIAGSTDSLKRIKRCVEDAKLGIEEIILEPLASAEAVLYSQEKNTGVALVDIGGGTTDVAIFYDNVLRHSAVIPFGGNVITEDIRKVVGLTFADAETLKIQFGTAINDASTENNIIVIPSDIPGHAEKELAIKHLIGIIQARMEEIIGQIQFAIEKSGYAQLLGAGIVITGGGALLKHLKQLINYHTGLNVRIGYPGQFLSGDSVKINEPLFATAVGLIMQGFSYMDQHPETRSFAPKLHVETVLPPVVPVENEEKEILNDFEEDEEEEAKTHKHRLLPKTIKNFLEKVSTVFEDDVDEQGKL